MLTITNLIPLVWTEAPPFLLATAKSLVQHQLRISPGMWDQDICVYEMLLQNGAQTCEEFSSNS